jgi:thiol-disulfide isomerase/thioredoxin
MFVLALALVACSPSKSGDTSVTDSGGTSSGTTADTAGTVATGLGDVTWSVNFDATAEAAGNADCTYTRSYTGVEDRSAPWVCPSCDNLFRADVTLSGQDCVGLISSTAPAASEWIGDDGTTWYRNGASYGTAAPGDGTVALAAAFPGNAAPVGSYDLQIAGTLTLGRQAGDPLAGWEAADTYKCGWPKANPSAYTGDYTLAVGSQLPDGVFEDTCGDNVNVRLGDFAGRYAIVDISATDCGPCQSAAGDEEAFVASMAAKGIEVDVITMLAPSLSDVSSTTTKAVIKQWTDQFALTSPVLADRDWGFAVASPALGDSFGYPTFIVVNPDQTVLTTQTGYGGNFDGLAAAIEADAGT